jgi:hypothetical protein
MVIRGSLVQCEIFIRWQLDKKRMTQFGRDPAKSEVFADRGLRLLRTSHGHRTWLAAARKCLRLCARPVRGSRINPPRRDSS